jgi:hypothetical protein
VEKGTLAFCEENIRKGWGTFMSVGESLLKIRAEKLYRAEYSSFEDYYRCKWQYEKSQVYRLIDAAKVLQSLSPIGENSTTLPNHLPTSESQVRPLVGLDGEVARAVWGRVVTEANKGQLPITARLVAKHVRAVVPEHRKRTSAMSVIKESAPDARGTVSQISASFDELLRFITDSEARISAQRLRERVLRLIQRHLK